MTCNYHADLSVNVTLPSVVMPLLANGTLTVSIHLSKDGIEHWYRSVQSHPRLGVKTNTAMTLEDVVSFFGPGSKYTGKSTLPFREAAPPSGDPLNSVVVDNMEKAIQRSTLKNLNSIYRNGVSNQLPSDSLSWWDLGREDYDDFAARAFLVARKIGEARITSRISSDATKGLLIKGAHSLDEWWFRANSQQRWEVLSTQSKRGDTPKTCLEGLKNSYLRRLELLPCPFRANLPVMEKSQDKGKQRQDEASDSDEYDYSGGSLI